MENQNQKQELFILYMNKNIESVHNIYKDIEFLSREIPNPTISYVKDALEELKSNMQYQLRNLN